MCSVSKMENFIAGRVDIFAGIVTLAGCAPFQKKKAFPFHPSAVYCLSWISVLKDICAPNRFLEHGKHVPNYPLQKPKPELLFHQLV